MPLVNFSNLDFEQIKVSIKDYLRANSNFTDYDFEGSNLSTVIDALAYNTYITSYNANMVTNEVFIDSATLRENVVSLARNIGYVPRSRTSSRAVISFEVDVSGTTASSVTLKKGLVAITSQRFGSQDYTFSIPKDIVKTVDSDGIARFYDITIYEGTFVETQFPISSRTPNQKIILPNTGIDTSLMTVEVLESSTSNIKTTYTQYSGLIDIKSDSRVYFLQEIPNEKYELLFGDGIFGKKLEEPNVVKVGYMVSAGAAANGIDSFTFSGELLENNGTPITTAITALVADGSSQLGAQIESVDSIKRYAPQIYASQNRAVTASDYEALIPNIYPEAESVSAYGGEDLSPPQYGKVFVSIKPVNGVFLSTCLKDFLLEKINRYKVAGIQVQLIDLNYLYIETDSNVYYNTNKAQSGSVVKADVLSSITEYTSSSALNKFGARFKYSKYQTLIDNSNIAATSNITNVQIRRDLEPVINKFGQYELCYGNRFQVKNSSTDKCGTNLSDAENKGFNIRSSGFKISGISDTLYLGDIPNMGLKTGKLFFFKLISPKQAIIVKQNVGIVDYIHGEIKLNPIKFVSTSIVRNKVPIIEVSAIPYSNDVIGLQDLYLQLDLNYTTVNSVVDKIDSGDDISGSNYIVSPSYDGNELVRGTPQLISTETSSAPSASTTSSSTSNTSSTTLVNSNRVAQSTFNNTQSTSGY
jgi:hypothetical protein